MWLVLRANARTMQPYFDAKHLSRWQQAQTAKEPRADLHAWMKPKAETTRAAPPKHGCSKQIWFIRFCLDQLPQIYMGCHAWVLWKAKDHVHEFLR